MAKPKSDDPRCNMVSVRLTDSEAVQLDKNRGGLTRADFIRSKILRRGR